MADKKISDFTATTSVASSDVFEMENAGGNSRMITAQNLAKGLRNVGGVRGALVRKAADQNGANYSAGADIAWDQETYDTDSIHDTVTNNTRLTVPSGVSYVRVSCALRLNDASVDTYQILRILKNGAVYDGMGQQATEIGSTTSTYISAESALVPVTAGDYFTAFLIAEDTGVNIVATQSWFAMEIVG